MAGLGNTLVDLPLPPAVKHGSFFGPKAYEIDSLDLLEREVFGPMYVSHTTKGNKLTVTFDYVGEGLRISKNDKESGTLTWFELAAEPEDGKKLAWCKANARIVHKKYVAVSADDVPNPKYVRFAWHPVSFHNLESSAGLPAIGFRTDIHPERWHER